MWNHPRSHSLSFVWEQPLSRTHRPAVTPVTRRRGSEVHFSYFSLQVLILLLFKFFVSPLCAPTNQPPPKTDSALPESQLHRNSATDEPLQVCILDFSCLETLAFYRRTNRPAHVGYVDGLWQWRRYNNGYVNVLWQRLCRWIMTMAESVNYDNGWVNDHGNDCGYNDGWVGE